MKNLDINQRWMAPALSTVYGPWMSMVHMFFVLQFAWIAYLMAFESIWWLILVIAVETVQPEGGSHSNNQRPEKQYRESVTW